MTFTVYLPVKSRLKQTSIRLRAYFSSPYPASIGVSIGLVHHFCIAHNREVWRHKNLILWNYRIGWHIQKEQDGKSPPLPVSTNWWGDLSTVMNWWLHSNPSKIELDRLRSTFKMGTAQLHSVTEISPKSLFLCVPKIPIRYGLHTGKRAIRYSQHIALLCLFVFTKRSLFLLFRQQKNSGTFQMFTTR